MIGQSEMKEVQGWANQAVECGDRQAWGCGYALVTPRGSSALWGGWGYGAPGGGAHTDMEACNLGGDLSNLHIWLHLLSLLVLFLYLDLPANAWSFIVEKIKWKIILKKEKKQQMYNWSFVRLPYCVFLADISWCMWDSSSSSSSSSLHSEPVHSMSLKPPA